MARQNVYTYPDAEDYYAEVTLAGWFDVDKAESYPEGTRWDGQNTISLVAGGRWDHETLYRTSGGRWVLRHWSQWEGRGETWAFINDDAARNWLIRCEYDDSAIAAATGEDMPAEIGRPVIGPQLKVHLPEALIARIDAVAEVTCPLCMDSPGLERRSHDRHHTPPGRTACGTPASRRPKSTGGAVCGDGSTSARMPCHGRGASADVPVPIVLGPVGRANRVRTRR